MNLNFSTDIIRGYQGTLGFAVSNNIGYYNILNYNGKIFCLILCFQFT